jgi:hypothetical protein
MPSNAYIATDGEDVMKVGKANDVKRREKQIAIPITFTIACLDEAAALRVENRLRDFVIEKGGIQRASSIDWFKFEPQIYKMLCQFAQQVLDTDETTGIDLDDEINMLVMRYHKLLLDEAQSERRRLEEEYENQRKRLEEERQAMRQQIYEQMRVEREASLQIIEQLVEEITVWRVKCEIMQEALDKTPQKPN